MEWLEHWRGCWVHFSHAGRDDAGFSVVMVNAPRLLDGNGRFAFDAVIGSRVEVRRRQLRIAGKLWAVLDGSGGAKLVKGERTLRTDQGHAFGGEE